MATPLPKVNSPQVQLIADQDPNYLSAYNVCLTYERELSANKNKLRYVRILGYLLLYAPNRGVRSEVTKCVYSDLTDIGASFERYVITTFKKYKGRTPKASEHPSRPSFEVTKDEVKVNITKPPRNHNDAKHHALIRDNWRCVVTDTIDLGAPEDIAAKLDPVTVGVYTQCAHIIPEAIFFGVDSKSEDNLKLDYSASILAVLKRFRYDINKFNGEKVHSLINVMSMESNVHDKFDRLNLYLKATSEEHCYEVKWFGMKPHHTLRQFVTFSTSDPENLPVPSPELFSLHATCCKVAHYFGAAEYIDEIYHDADKISVLSADGSSGIMLDYLLLSLLKPEHRHDNLPKPIMGAAELEPVTL